MSEAAAPVNQPSIVQACPYPLGELQVGLNYEEYAMVGGCRASTLHRMRRSPAHYRAELLKPREKSDALEFGKLFHLAVEMPEKFLDTYIVEPEFTGYTKKGELSTRSKEAQEKKASWYGERKPGEVVVKSDWVDPLLGMLKSVREHRLVGNLVRNGIREASGWAIDPETGLLLQIRADFISERGFLVDFKTTRNANPHSPFFIGQIFSQKYDEDPFYSLSAAHYTHTVRIGGFKGVRHDQMTLVAIEKEPPYGIGIFPLDIGCIAPGEQWRHVLTARYNECLKTDKWPCYPEQAVPVMPPQWVELPV